MKITNTTVGGGVRVSDMDAGDVFVDNDGCCYMRLDSTQDYKIVSLETGELYNSCGRYRVIHDAELILK